MTRIILVGDIHIRDTSPASRKEGYREDIIAKLEYVADLEKRIKADAVVWAGDVFHFPDPRRTSHATVLRMLEVVEKFNNVYVVPGNHDLCVSDDTQALTDQGWKTLYELDGTERFATLNPETQETEFHAASRIHTIDYSGDAYSFQSKSVDLVTSPNHAFYVSTRIGNPIHRRTAKELHGLKYPTVLPNSYGVAEGMLPEAINWGCGVVDSTTAMRFLGWFVAEGTCDPPNRFTISQSSEVNPDHYSEIAGILTDMGVKFEQNSKTLRVYDSGLTSWLMQNVGRAGSKDMRLPKFLYSLDPYLIREFLHAYFKGDGTINASQGDREVADYSTASVAARCRNSALADDLCALAEIVGYKTRKSELREFPFGDSGYIGHAYDLGFSQGAKTHTLPRPTTAPYSGVMWCPEVPNHIWLARRNGKTVWTGNSNDRQSAIMEKQPLGVLIHGGLKILDGWDEDLPIYGVPWQQEWIIDGSVPDRAFKAFRDGTSTGRNPANSLAITHAPIYPPAEQLSTIFELVPTAGQDSIAEAMGGQGSLYYGHIHEDHGVFEDGGVSYCNVGALSRGSLHEYNLERDIQVAIWDSSKGFIPHIIPHKSAADLFYVEEHSEAVAERKNLDAFLKDVGQSKIAISSIESVQEYVRTREGIEEPVKKTAIEILTDVS